MMSRPTGGIGGRGPGETKLEINRRRARERIQRLEQEIERYGKQRENRRAKQGRAGLPIVAIVGYTNAGKSTLLNNLTRSEVLAEDKLFATLDQRHDDCFPEEREIILADTVGFIRELPKDLARAFRATLEEIQEADLLLHVVDISDPAHEQRSAPSSSSRRARADVSPRILVRNKIDQLSPEDRETVTAGEDGFNTVSISARNVETTKPLLATIEQRLWAAREDGA